MVIQVQIQALLVRGVVARTARGRVLEVAKPQTFDRTPSKVSRFIIACRLYIRMRMREVAVEEQIQWILSYIQGGAADV